MFFLQSKGGLKMPKREDINTVLVIGSGPIIIGQACEFDYSGTQACKALRGLGYKIVLILWNKLLNLSISFYYSKWSELFYNRVIQYW